ncbi:hypothetical protein HNR12_000960 [Streptomonospora nanhaiensis]|uniref:Uncharacterized protein n=1 Tax=Streptomonospora nanhaiensis TaxID=1323731 RepID=A0A853BH97_9ACTN|nr:hypothetical protein [Streptomonospora nanhaiensis]NYI94683.1 hypothetical protein [Streptomonospora nanhaiensis]
MTARHPALWVAAVAAAAGVAVALALNPPRLGGDPPGGPSAACPVAPAPGEPAARPRPYNPDSPGYAGAPPHPAAVVDTLDFARRTRDGAPLEAEMAVGDDPPGRAYELPEEWRPAGNGDSGDGGEGEEGGEERTAAQVVACVYYDAVGKPLEHCSYRMQDGTFAIAAVRMTVVVREAATGRTVGGFPLRSDPAKVEGANTAFLDTEYCPPSVVDDTEGPRTWLVPPRNSDFVEGLRPVVERRL